MHFWNKLCGKKSGENAPLRNLESGLAADGQPQEGALQANQAVERKAGISTPTKVILATLGGATLFVLGGVTAYFTLVRKSQEPECTSNATGVVTVYYGNVSNSGFNNEGLPQIAQYACNQIACSSSAAFLAFTNLLYPFMLKAWPNDQSYNSSEDAAAYTIFAADIASFRCRKGITGDVLGKPTRIVDDHLLDIRITGATPAP